MKRTSGRIGIGLVLVSLLVGACLTERDKGDTQAEVVNRPQAAMPDGPGAQEVVLAVRSQLERAFGTTNIQLPGVRNSQNSLGDFNVVGIRSVSDTEASSLNGLLSEPVKAMVDVKLPLRADGAFHLEDERSGLSIDVGLFGATASAREQSDGYVVYRSGYLNGAHIVHRPTEQGTEDYLYFPEKLPETSELRYDLALSEGVAGLRLIERTIEMLDAGGAPRLRMKPPYAVDGDGRHLAVNVAIEGCAYDTSAAMPWGRPTVQPGSRHCTVHLTWDSTAKAPLVVDPAWQITSVMVNFRVNMTATHLGGEKAIVIGGDTGPGTTAHVTTEYYDQASFSWAMGPSTIKQHTDHAAILTDNTLYVIGGRYGSQTSSTITPVVERLAIGPNGPGTVWEQGIGMMMGRHKHTATLIPGEGILVAGGIDTGNQPTSSAEFFAFGSNSWVSRPMTSARVGHTATRIGPKTVLVVGGKGNGAPSNTMEIFNQAGMPEPGWTQVAGNMPRGRAFHASTTLADGRILIAGGESPNGQGVAVTAEVDIYNPEQNSWAANVPPMSKGRIFFAATKAPFGDGVVVMGGKSTNDSGSPPLSSVELLNMGSANWGRLSDLKFPRSNFSTFTVDTGYVVVVGGATGASGTPGAIGTSEILGCTTDDQCTANNGDSYCSVDNACKPRKMNGATCDVRSAADGGKDCKEAKCRVCQSPDNLDTTISNCVDGVCCDTECTDQCAACNSQATGDKVGTCTPVTGKPRNGRPSCEGGDQPDDAECGGYCDGIDAVACKMPIGNICKKGCTNGTVDSRSCDGAGKCSVESKELCAPYACDDKQQQCTATCSVDADMKHIGCDINAECKDSLCFPRPTSCVDDNTMRLANGDDLPCGNYRCDKSEGKCLTLCTTAYDCKVVDPATATPYVCNDSRQCVESTSETTPGESTSCSISPANESSRFGWLAALAIAGAIATRRQRARA
jgi:hypothetical protein